MGRSASVWLEQGAVKYVNEVSKDVNAKGRGSGLSDINRLPTELKIWILELCADVSIGSVLSLSATDKTFYAIYKRSQKLQEIRAMYDTLEGFFPYAKLVLDGKLRRCTFLCHIVENKLKASRIRNAVFTDLLDALAVHTKISSLADFFLCLVGEHTTWSVSFQQRLQRLQNYSREEILKALYAEATCPYTIHSPGWFCEHHHELARYSRCEGGWKYWMDEIHYDVERASFSVLREIIMETLPELSFHQKLELALVIYSCGEGKLDVEPFPSLSGLVVMDREVKKVVLEAVLRKLPAHEGVRAS